MAPASDSKTRDTLRMRILLVLLLAMPAEAAFKAAPVKVRVPVVRAQLSAAGMSGRPLQLNLPLSAPLAAPNTLNVPKLNHVATPQAQESAAVTHAAKVEAAVALPAQASESATHIVPERAVALTSRKARRQSRRLSTLQKKMQGSVWLPEGLHAAATLDEAAVGKPTGESVDPVRIGHALMQAVLPHLERNRAGHNIAVAAREIEVRLLLLSPDPRKDWLRPEQGAVYSLARREIMLNSNPLGLGVAELAGLADNPVRLAEIAEQIAPIVLHELKHWRTSILLGEAAHKENEYEAYHVQALYLLETLREDPTYLERLPKPLHNRYVGLLQAWLKGPQALSEWVERSYHKVPSLFHSDPVAEAAKNEKELAGWTDRYENYEAARDDLEEQLSIAKQYEGSMGGMRVSMGVTRVQALQKQLREFPSRSLVRQIMAEIAQSMYFWRDPTRLLITKSYYDRVWQRMHAEWEGWLAENPDFVLPTPPTAMERLRAWFGRFIFWG
jgi:hypothetical protein